MMNETLALGECPIVRPEGIYFGGRRVIRIGMGDVGLGGVGDLLAYRQMWDPFVKAHYRLWVALNEKLESAIGAKDCPAGIFSAASIQNLDQASRDFCASLRISRMYISQTDPYGIWTRWNHWAGKSSADMLINAKLILEDLQTTVMAIGGPYKDELVRIAHMANFKFELPDMPQFSAQQDMISRIEGAFAAVKGVLQIIGYGAGETLMMAADTTEAVAEGIQETAKAVPQAVSSPWVWVGVTAVLAVVGGTLIVYYHPRKA